MVDGMSTGALLPFPATFRRLIGVFVISDELVVRAGLTMFIVPEPDLDLVGEGCHGEASLALLRRSDPDVVIVDLDAGRGHAVLLAEVTQAAPDAKLLILSGLRNSERHRQAALQGGARGLVEKGAGSRAVVDAIHRVHAGALHFQPESASSELPGGAAASPPGDAHGRHIAALTDRERAIVGLVAEGLRNDQIALRIGLAEKTVRNHLWSVFNKLGVGDRLALAVFAYQHGLADPPA